MDSRSEALASLLGASSFKEHIAAYYGLGWWPIPLYGSTASDPSICLCGMPDCVTAGKHPYSKWTTDPKPSLFAATYWADAGKVTTNVGIRTGVFSNLLVVDFDTIEVAQLFNEEMQKHEDAPPLMIKTGRGLHAYYAYTSELASLSGAIEKIDVQGNNRFVVAAPSIHRNGTMYSVVRQRCSLSPAPAWAVSYLRNQPARARSRTKMTSAGAEADRPFKDYVLTPISSPIAEGGRNEALYSLVVELCKQQKRAKYTDAHIYQRAANFASKECVPPLPVAVASNMVARRLAWQKANPASGDRSSYGGERGDVAHAMLEMFEEENLLAEPPK